MSRPSLLRRIAAGTWTAITRIRLAMANILFLVLLALIYFVYMGGGPEPLPEKAALLLNVSGKVVDQKTAVNPLQAVLSEPTPEQHEVLLRDIIESIEYAADDPAINSLVMELDSLVYLGISKTQEIIPALEAFRETGKPIVALGDYYTQDQYLLASYADTVISHPLGGVAIEGFSSYRNYFREALDKLSINVHVFRAGEQKSYVEPFLRDDMSEPVKELTARWLGDLWRQYTSTVELQRNLNEGALDNYVNNLPDLLRQQGGDAGQAALQAGLIDKLLGRSEGNDYLVQLVGASNDDGLYEAIEFERYVSRKRPLQLGAAAGDRIGVITATGNILPGDQPPGAIGGDSLARLIRGAVDEDDIKAIVLRVNSGGGSYFASEIVRQQILYARQKDKPLIVSMGAIAASGGYYIAADANEIWATPATITGSIGVFAAFPTFEGLLQRVGIHTDGVGTTKLAGALRPDRPVKPEQKAVINSGIDFAYRNFLQVVAGGREMSVESVDPLAQGRVWSAADALEAGLIDQLGGLEEAIASAAEHAGLSDYTVDFVELPVSPRELLMRQLANRGISLNLWQESATGAALLRLLSPVRAAVREVTALQDPNNLYVRCLACGLTPEL